MSHTACILAEAFLVEDILSLDLSHPHRLTNCKRVPPQQPWCPQQPDETSDPLSVRVLMYLVYVCVSVCALVLKLRYHLCMPRCIELSVGKIVSPESLQIRPTTNRHPPDSRKTGTRNGRLHIGYDLSTDRLTD